MANRKRCKAKTKRGKNCRNWARPDSDYCSIHSTNPPGGGGSRLKTYTLIATLLSQVSNLLKNAWESGFFDLFQLMKFQHTLEAYKESVTDPTVLEAIDEILVDIEKAKTRRGQGTPRVSTTYVRGRSVPVRRRRPSSGQGSLRRAVGKKVAKKKVVGKKVAKKKAAKRKATKRKATKKRT